ncbi:hypothetical protein BLA29_011964 [Euroglyphus maynei]|uniref:Uncharacterized protein n=1 Tax=Euroglyphus maynei TaxID=6958 RepID=A0A1Y3AM71_EURMA|nr:hypothetical protein BLA29_011964 [Euroglyphus maynei]
MFVADISSQSNVFTAANNQMTDSNKPNTVRIHMLLMIMDNFDKLIYNAINESCHLFGMVKS